MDLIKYSESILQSTKESTVGMEYDLRFDLIDFIKMELKENDMTQKSLAQRIGMKESQLTRILKAESNITLETVARIYHAFARKPTIAEKTESYVITGKTAEHSTFVKKSIISFPDKYRIKTVSL